MQNDKNDIPQADKPLQEVSNSAVSSDRVKAPVAGTGPMDSEGGQQFCMEADLTPSSAQGGSRNELQAIVLLEHIQHPLPASGAGNTEKPSYADGLRHW